jgi:hypothetical protein
VFTTNNDATNHFLFDGDQIQGYPGGTGKAARQTGRLDSMIQSTVRRPTLLEILYSLLIMVGRDGKDAKHTTFVL